MIFAVNFIKFWGFLRGFAFFTNSRVNYFMQFFINLKRVNLSVCLSFCWPIYTLAMKYSYSWLCMNRAWIDLFFYRIIIVYFTLKIIGIALAILLQTHTKMHEYITASDQHFIAVLFNDCKLFQIEWNWHRKLSFIILCAK